MASAKKGKKNKGKTLALSDFLQETPGSVPSMPIRKSTTNWADEVEDSHDLYEMRAAKTTSMVLPTAPKASRDYDDIAEKVPQEPPFMAYLTNLPYDVDEDEIVYFFRNMKIANMRIPKDERPGETPKLKGFGYVEFEDRESLLNALVIPDTTIKNRRIRIEVATDYDNDKRRMNRMDMNRDRGNRSEMSSMGDWRSGPRQDNSDMERRNFSRDRDREDSSSMWRDGERRPPRGSDSDRPFTRSTDRYRDSNDRESSSDFGRSRDDKFMQRRFEDRGPRNGGFSRTSRDEEPKTSEARQRPKLLLTPRTKPVEAEPEKVSSSAAIFGNAKPVDTAARERQIEERLAKDDVGPKRDGSTERKEEAVKEKEKEKEKIKEEPEQEQEDVQSDLNGVVEKAPAPKKNLDDQEKKEVKSNEEKHKEVKKREEKKEKEKEMPKLKKTEPPNFVANNKFAFLENEDSSD